MVHNLMVYRRRSITNLLQFWFIRYKKIVSCSVRVQLWYRHEALCNLCYKRNLHQVVGSMPFWLFFVLLHRGRTIAFLQNRYGTKELIDVMSCILDVPPTVFRSWCWRGIDMQPRGIVYVNACICASRIIVPRFASLPYTKMSTKFNIRLA